MEVVSNSTYLVPECPRLVHGPWHGLLVCNMTLCTKRIRVWNRLLIPCDVGVFYRCFADCWMLVYKMSACKMCTIWQITITACNIQCQLPTTLVLVVSEIFQRHYSDANKQDFWNEVNFHLSTPPKIMVSTKVCCIFYSNLVVLASIGGV